MVTEKKLMLGNEAIARGLVENGCAVATSYPGTPASEILEAVAAFQKHCGISMHTQWAVNEKIAFEIAYAGSISGLRTSVSMKQVGLNVASDPLMSAAYMGTRGGFVIISADDPGPHSSQTEQDSRMMAMMAKIPVLDPDSPAQAKDMIALAYELSEKFEIPVMLRPTTRVCHSRQDIAEKVIAETQNLADFQKDPTRWAATPKFRFQLHTQLEKKLTGMAVYEKTAPICLNPETVGKKALVVSGVAAAHAKEIFSQFDLWETIPVYQVLQPFPLHEQFTAQLLNDHEDILVIEETTGVIEMQLAYRQHVRGKIDRSVPRVGELAPEIVEKVIRKFAGMEHQAVGPVQIPGRRPTLCAGCPHRASFFAIKKAAPRAIYTSDIGCYTLGINLGAVDTVLCMGAAISQAAGFYHAYKNQARRPDIVATIGDSTFFHAGIPALIDAVAQNVHFVLVILDNRTTAMTGNQPTPASGRGIGNDPLTVVDIEKLVRGCGIGFVRTADPYHLDTFIPLVREAVVHSRKNGPAVVIARHPCLLDRLHPDPAAGRVRVEITDDCDGCRYCIDHFECPAIVFDEEKKRAGIDTATCSDCGVCLHVCPKNAIRPVPDGSEK